MNREVIELCFEPDTPRIEVSREVAQMITQLRDDLDITDHDLAERAGVAYGLVWNWSHPKGSRGLSVHTLLHIARAFDKRLVIRFEDIEQKGQ